MLISAEYELMEVARLCAIYHGIPVDEPKSQLIEHKLSDKLAQNDEFSRTLK